MNTNRHFPEVSNWERADGQYYDDHVTNKWHNLQTGYMMRTITVTGPFGTNTSKHVLQIRELYAGDSETPQDHDMLWNDVEMVHEKTFDRQYTAEKAAYQFAQEHNDPEE